MLPNARATERIMVETTQSQSAIGRSSFLNRLFFHILSRFTFHKRQESITCVTEQIHEIRSVRTFCVIARCLL